MIQECLIRRKIAKFFFFFENLQVSNAKTNGIFFKKKSWSHMIPNRLIRREMQKKIFFWWRRKSAVNGGGGGPAATAEKCRLPPNFFLPFLAELDNSESFETNFFFFFKFPQFLHLTLVIFQKYSNFFLSFLAELDNFESFQTNIYSFQKNSLSFSIWHFEYFFKNSNIYLEPFLIFF